MRVRGIGVAIVVSALAIGAVQPSTAAPPVIDTSVTATGIPNWNPRNPHWSFTGVSVGSEPIAGVFSFEYNTSFGYDCRISLQDLFGNVIEARAVSYWYQPATCALPAAGGSFVAELVVTRGIGSYAGLVGHTARLSGSVTALTMLPLPLPVPLPVPSGPPVALVAQLLIA